MNLTKRVMKRVVTTVTRRKALKAPMKKRKKNDFIEATLTRLPLECIHMQRQHQAYEKLISSDVCQSRRFRTTRLGFVTIQNADKSYVVRFKRGSAPQTLG
mmetsp:Transcript_24338/g.44024  ORF Transcript_24338/g.44024 Transcript_24338/m.44024 type:complete len:101 (-) Transcript_24338:49-351(-)